MKRLASVLALVCLLLAACGRDTDEELVVTDEGPKATASAKATGRPKATKAPGDPAATARAGDPGQAAGAPAKTTAPAVKTDEGGTNQPKAGSYTYNIKGEATSPFDPTGQSQPYSGEQTLEISNSGPTTTREYTNSEQAGRLTLRTRHEPTRVLLISFKQETPQGDFSCELNPPVVIVKFPVKPESYGTQELSGSGNGCGGSIEIQVVRKETMKDATGRSWSTWRTFTKQTSTTSQGTLRQETTRWLSPDLGVEVRSDDKRNGEFRAGGASQKFSQSGTAVLKKHP